MNVSDAKKIIMILVFVFATGSKNYLCAMMTGNLGNVQFVAAGCARQRPLALPQDEITASYSFISGFDRYPAHAFFAVCGGHGPTGGQAAHYVCDHLHENIVQNPAFISHPWQAIERGFRTTSNYFIRDEYESACESGATVASVFFRVPVRGNGAPMVVIANLGNARAVLCRAGRSFQPLSDHVLQNGNERERIRMKGRKWRRITRDKFGWKVKGKRLSVTRAIGCRSLKKYGVVATPEIVRETITARDDFLVLGSAGLWKAMSNREVVDFFQEKLVDGENLETICDQLINAAFEKRKHCDIAVVVIKFIHAVPMVCDYFHRSPSRINFSDTFGRNTLSRDRRQGTNRTRRIRGRARKKKADVWK